MKRIISACLEQTIRFEDITGVTKPETEFEHYKEKLERRGTKYQVLETQTLEGGALLVKLRKQYNSYKTEGYM